MARPTAFLVISALAIGGAVGCMGQPFLAESLGLLPGPPTSLLTSQSSSATSLLDQLLAGLDGSTDTTNGDTTGDDTTGDDTTGDDTTGDDTQTCPDGQVWVGTVTVNGMSVSINACVPESLAAQYGVI